jgi:pimeloyl-ACP methyl ester carboxylesterase
MTEEVVVFGDGLSGVFTRPDGAPARTGIVLLSAGILHRVGPNRLHVTLARALAGAGIAALRFDLSGLGESEARSDDLSYEARTNREGSAALDVLASAGVERFLLFGLCSGADNAFRIALADPRVGGAVVVQSYSFTRPGYTLDYYGRRLLQPRIWRRWLRGQVEVREAGSRILKSLRTPSAGTSDPDDDPARSWRMPPTARVVADVRTLLGRGVDLLFVYSHPSPAEYNFRSILRREVAGSAHVEVETFTDSDHTFTPLAHQSRVADRVVAWARRRESSGPGEAPGRRTA